MGVLGTIGRMLGSKRPAKGAGVGSAMEPKGAAGLGPQVDSITGVREVHPAGSAPAETGEDAAEVGALLPRGVRNRQEVVAELQKNYREVLELVRKMDQSLDARTAREEQLLRMAESSATSLRLLPELRAQQESLRQALGELVSVTRDGIERSTVLGEAQAAALERATSLLEDAARREQGVDAALEGVRGAVDRSAGASERLAEVIEVGREDQAARDTALAEALRKSQAVMVTAVGISAAMVVLAVVMALVALAG